MAVEWVLINSIIDLSLIHAALQFVVAAVPTVVLHKFWAWEGEHKGDCLVGSLQAWKLFWSYFVLDEIGVEPSKWVTIRSQSPPSPSFTAWRSGFTIAIFEQEIFKWRWDWYRGCNLHFEWNRMHSCPVPILGSCLEEAYAILQLERLALVHDRVGQVDNLLLKEEKSKMLWCCTL